ncbi:MAG: TolC family protein [Candidatus Omnitrophica bacterium]|nr:TolC family protein [Candidatus Omnitrophota bacterium]
MKKFIILFFIFISMTFSDEIFSLNDALKIAIENNIKLKIYKDKIEQASISRDFAFSYFFPRLSASFTYRYLGDNQPISLGPFPPMKFTDDNLYNLTFSVSQPLFTGGKITKGYEISKVSYEKAVVDYETELQNLILDVKKAYFEVLKAEKMVDVSRKYRELTEKHLKDVKEMFEEGIATKLDILKVELALKQAEVRITDSENYLQLSKTRLNFLLNRPPEYNFEPEDILEFKRERSDYEIWKEIALKERKEIKGMEKVLSIYGKKVELERANLFPQISLFFNYNMEKGTQTSMDGWEDNWNTGVFLSYDIWNWGETRNKVKKAEKEKAEMEKQFELLKNGIELEVKSAYLNLLSAEQKVSQCKKQIELAEENLRVAELLHQEGMATTTDVLDASTSLTEARNSFYNALYEYNVAYAELEKAVGKWRN